MQSGCGIVLPGSLRDCCRGAADLQGNGPELYVTWANGGRDVWGKQ
jgi:hypothetical protein